MDVIIFISMFLTNNKMTQKEIIPVIGKDDNINVKNFETLDEFQDFYNLHKNEINALSTVKLNRIYHIKDYKITRRTTPEGGEEKNLFFRRLFKNETKEPKPNPESRINDLEQHIKAIESEITKMKKSLLEIIDVINNAH